MFALVYITSVHRIQIIYKLSPKRNKYYKDMIMLSGLSNSWAFDLLMFETIHVNPCNKKQQ